MESGYVVGAESVRWIEKGGLREGAGGRQTPTCCIHPPACKRRGIVLLVCMVGTTSPFVAHRVTRWYSL